MALHPGSVPFSSKDWTAISNFSIWENAALAMLLCGIAVSLLLCIIIVKFSSKSDARIKPLLRRALLSLAVSICLLYLLTAIFMSAETAGWTKSVLCFLVLFPVAFFSCAKSAIVLTEERIQWKKGLVWVPIAVTSLAVFARMAATIG